VIEWAPEAGSFSLRAEIDGETVEIGIVRA